MLDVEDRMDLPRGRKVKLARVTATHAYNTVRAKPSRSHLGDGKRSVAEVDRVARREFERFARGVVMRLLLRLRIDDCAFSCVEVGSGSAFSIASPKAPYRVPNVAGESASQQVRP